MARYRYDPASDSVKPAHMVADKMPRGKASSLPKPYFFADIEPFVSIATKDTTLISSRSQLRAYERDNGIRQCGDLKGKIIPEQKKRIAEATYVSPEDQKAADFKWVD